jgi:hypothetical protein
VLLVDGEPGESADEGETRFLQVALDQGGDVVTGIEPQVITDANLAEADLSPFDMIYLCNVSAPAPAVVDKLEAFVRGGGGLGFFVGTQVDPSRYNELFWKGGQGLLPLALGELQGDPDKPDHLFLAAPDHPLCGHSGEGLGKFLGIAVLVGRYLTMVDDPKSGASIMARVHDAEGSPAIVTKSFGSGGGQVIAFAFTAGDRWSNWPKTPAMLVVAQEAQRFAAKAQDLGGFNLTTVGVHRIVLDPGTYKPDVRIRALGGDDEEHTLTAVEAKKAADSPATQPQPNQASNQPPNQPPSQPAPQAPAALALDVPMGDLRAVGAYEVELLQHTGATEKRLFARNVPVEESRLVRFTEADLRRVYPAEIVDKVTFR